MADEPESLGSYLKHQRESKKISLRELAKNTRVREHILRSIEGDRYELLPPATYVKGFLSAYARYLRLNESDVLLRYERVLNGKSMTPPRAELTKRTEKEVPVGPLQPEGTAPLPPPQKPKRKIQAAQPSKPQKRILWNARQTWVVAGVIAASLIFYYFFSPYPSRIREPIPGKPAPGKAAVAEKPAIEEKPTAPAPPVSAATSVPKTVVERKESPAPSSPAGSNTSLQEKKPISLRLKAVEETWVSLETDGQPGKGMILKPGEAISAQGSNRIRMIVGNAGGLDLTFNGKLLEKFGKSGQVVTLIFTPTGVEVKRPEKTGPPKE